MSFIVAIDGPAGTGKGTVTEILAKKLKLMNMDTGATYRCVALAMLQQGIDISEIDKIENLLKEIQIQLKDEQGKQTVFLNGKNVTDQIRSKEVTAIVSQVSGIIPVRIAMANFQRKLGEGKDVILEGRDTTTYVFPNADVKIYLDADPEERARRRVKQNKEKNIDMTYEEVLANINMRDENDKNKEIGALKIAEDATVIDTTHMTIAETVKKIEKVIKDKQKQIALEKKIYTVRPETTWKKVERRIVKAILHGVYVLLFRIEMTGDMLPEEGAYIVCANHINYWDAVGLVTACKRKIYFMAKEDLFYHPLLNWIAHLFDVIPVKRGKQDMEAMKRSLGVLKRGEVLGLFPEGTRKGVQKGEKVKNGAAYMALRTQTKVVPVGIQGNFAPFKKVKLNYGKPLEFPKVAGKSPEKEELEAASKEIMDHIIMLTNEGK